MRDTEAAKAIAPDRGAVDAVDACLMIESSPDGMLLADEQGRILVANARIGELFGYDRRDLVGRSIEDLLPERHRGAHLAHRTRYRAAPAVRAMGDGSTLSGLRRDGTEFPVEVSLSPIDRDGRTDVVATVRDISDRLASDAHVHAVLDTVHAATDGLFMFDPDTLRFEYVNRGAVNQLGYSEAELLAMTPLHLKPEFTRRSFQRLLEPLLAGSIPSRTFTTVHRRKDGTDVAVEIILEYPQARRPGDRRLVVAMVRDISDRLAAELEYRNTVEAFRAAFHRAPVAVSLATISGDEVHLSSVNEAYCRLLGYQADDLIDRAIVDVVAEPDRERVMTAARKAAAGGVSIGAIEVDLVRADGSLVPVWAHSSILETVDGEATTVLSHIVDLTERRQGEDERERARLWTEGLAEIRAAVLDDQPLDDLLTLVCEWARLVTGADNAFVTSPDFDDDRHAVVAVDRSDTGRILPDRFTIDEPARRALAGETYHIPDLDLAAEIDPTNRAAVRCRSQETRSGIIVPIATPEPMLLFVVSDRQNVFDRARIAMVEALASEAATALELARSRRERSRLALLEDRERMAHDFHDLVIQRLFAAGMSLNSVQALVDDRAAVDRIGNVVTEIDRAIAELRSAIFHLTTEAPTTSARRLAAVVAKAEDWFGFEPAFRVDGDPESIPESVLEQLVPALTEMLSNAARHGAADAVDIVVTTGCTGTALRVADNGVGFDPEAVNRSGRASGLANLVARAERLGGTCTVTADPGSGTTIDWSAPH